jgi:hypothetical protein
MTIALSINPVAIIGGGALLIAAIYILLKVFCNVLKGVDKLREEEENIFYEEWMASDGKKYMWPVNHPRSSRKEETNK